MMKYEDQCSEAIIEQLGRIGVHQRHCEQTERRFFHSLEPEAFVGAEAALRACGWDKLPGNPCINVSFSFGEIEIDCLLRIPENRHLNITSPKISSVSPSKIWLEAYCQQPFSDFETVQTSDNELLNMAYPEYAVFEFSSDPTKFTSKLANLERNLSILLTRQRLLNSAAELRNIVKVVGIATPSDINELIGQFIEAYSDMLPLLSRLFAEKRVVVVKVDSNPATLSHLSNSIRRINTVRFFKSSDDGTLHPLSNTLNYSDAHSCSFLISSARMPVVSKPGCQLCISILENGVPGTEVPLDSLLYSIAGSGSVELLSAQVSVIWMDFSSVCKRNGREMILILTL
ncbi:hypothetical protein BCR33DRAFT_855623, partial [Rhizoclosmatium globosum]